MKVIEKKYQIRHENWAHELEAVLPQSATRFTLNLIERRWGSALAPLTTQLAYLQYDFHGYPALKGVHQGRVVRTESLIHAAMTNQQTVGAGRFGEAVFGLYTPPPTGPQIQIVEIDQAAFPHGGHADYEGLYRQTSPQRYGPQTQLKVTPAEFKNWVWSLELKDQYRAYVAESWPPEAVISSPDAHPLKTAVKSAFVLAAYLQNREHSLSSKGLELALQVAALNPNQPWETLNVEQLQRRYAASPDVDCRRLRLYRYTSTDIWCFSQPDQARRLLYIPGNSSPFQEFADLHALHHWVVETGHNTKKRNALAAHFNADDRNDGVFHAGVTTALQGMAIFPEQHHLSATAGFFNNDGFWDPGEYVELEKTPAGTDPFAQWVVAMKQAALDSIDSIYDDAQVNREQLSAVVEPVVQWINRYGPLALLIPGGEGLLALAGLMDAGYGLAEAVNAKTPAERSQGISRTVFGVLNALPVISDSVINATGSAVEGVSREHTPTPEIMRADIDSPVSAPDPAHPVSVADPDPDPVMLMKGFGQSVERFSDEALAQIRQVSGVSDETLRQMQTPNPLLQDTISRFAIDQDLQRAIDVSAQNPIERQLLINSRSEQFSQRYDALQQTDNEWLKWFRQQYPGLPKSAVEQMLERSGVDITAPHSANDLQRVSSQLSHKARHYEQHFRLCRAYEGLYLQSPASGDYSTLVLHTLERLPGWSPGVRIEVLDGTLGSKIVDSIGPIDAAVKTQLIKPVDGSMNIEQALLNVLTAEQRRALGLRGGHELEDLHNAIRANTLPHAELMIGLQRMDSGLSFHPSGLRGGGFPNTAQATAFSQQVMRLQVKEIYPSMSDSLADDFLRNLGSGAQAELERLKGQMEQLTVDITEWIEDIHRDIDDLDINLLSQSEGEARGMNPAELAAENEARLERRMDKEREVRHDLAEELIAIWQQRSGAKSRVYEDERFIGFHLELNVAPVHSLPDLNIQFDSVISLSMPFFRVTQRSSINGFLECFPNLRRLNMKGMDLRLFNEFGQEVGSLPRAIGRMTKLETLDLQATGLSLTRETAGHIAGLSRLRVLELSDNPLGLAPPVLEMPVLRQLKLRNAALTSCPIGIAERPYLERLDLRDNQLTRIPVAVRRQSVGRGTVLLDGNPLVDVESLQWVAMHRRETGINVWLAKQTHRVFLPESWTSGLIPARAVQWSLRWEKIAVKPQSERFFATLEGLARTADFVVDYEPLQKRVWQMIDEMSASPELCQRLFEAKQWSALEGDDPFSRFVGLEDSASEFIASAAKKSRMDGGLRP